MKEVGKIDWAFSLGRIPLLSTGKEPDMLSNDMVSILNTTQEDAIVEMVIYYENTTPVGPYQIKIKPQRLRKIRINDLIDPEALQLEKNYSCYIKTNVKVVIQMSRMNTGKNTNAEMSTMAFPADN